MIKTINIACIGFGEAARAFVQGWSEAGINLSITAFDVKTENPSTHGAMAESMQNAGVSSCSTAAEAVRDADAIFSFVTADQARAAALSTVGRAPAGAFFFDCNSCAPDTKRGSAIEVEKAGGRYVDAAVMAPVHPGLHRTKIHLSGPHCDAAVEFGNRLDLNTTVIEGEVGTASAIKMVRSIMMKGLEATMMECVLAGRKAGVDEFVLESLDKTYPGFNFKEKAAYMLERVMVHGVRRAAEMREVALTVNQLGLDNSMASASVNWQQAIGEMKLDPNDSLAEDEYGPRADAVLSALERRGK